MHATIRLNSAISFVKTPLSADYAPLYLPLVKGRDYAAFVDSGPKTLAPHLPQVMRDAGVADPDLRFVIHTHSHADHVGGDVALKQKTGCLIAGHSAYAHWHADLERHFQEWARPFPELIPDSPALRAQLTDCFDAPHKLDLYVGEGTVFDMGGGVTLTGYSLPGHMLNDLGWFEASSRTFIVGDAITATDWPHFHMHLTVSGYRTTLSKMRALLRQLQVAQVFLSHFGPMPPGETLAMLDRSEAMMHRMDRVLLKVMSSKDSVPLRDIWHEVATAMGKQRDFQALNTVGAQVQDFVSRGLIREVEPRVYALR